MKAVEYTLVPLDRRTGDPAFKPCDVKPQITVDLDELYRVMAAVNPPHSLTEEKDKQVLIHSTARTLSEVFGCDIYYRVKGASEVHIQPSLWRATPRNFG